MNNLSFESLHKERKNFMRSNKAVDHAILQGEKKILISAPHGVPQIRLGRYKYAEIGALATALYLQKETNTYLIAKTKNNNDDANFDEESAYKDSIKKLIKDKKIKYLIDFHGLSSNREMDINLGTHLGFNLKNNEDAFNILHDSLVKEGFFVTIDQPFMASSRTISSSMARQFKNLWSLQIEINCAISNERKNIDKFRKLLDIFSRWIDNLV